MPKPGRLIGGPLAFWVGAASLLASGLWAQSGHPDLVFAEGFEIGSAAGWSASRPATETCARPIDLVDVSSPTSVVGTGTPASCTQTAFKNAVAGGGVIVFDCGPNPHTIALTSETAIVSYTVIDGGGSITLDGQGLTRILGIHSSFELLTPHLVAQRLSFRNGASFGPSGDLDFGGGAIFRLGGRVWILDSQFYDNRTTSTGNDVGGGAVYSVGVGETIVVGSLFDRNRGSNGGALGNLHNDLTVVNSVLTRNEAQGSAEVGGGAGGAIYIDGVDQDVIHCGVSIAGNTANVHGGGVFRVSNNDVGTHVVDRSTVASNTMPDVSPASAGGLYLQGVAITIDRSTISGNVSRFAAGMFIGPGSTITMANSTLEGNVALSGLAGGVAFSSGVTGTIDYTTFARNRAPGPLAFGGATAGGQGIVLSDSVFDDNEAGNGFNPITCSGTMVDGGGNMQHPVQRAGGGSDFPGSLCSAGASVSNPNLGALADNGGPTWTVRPGAGSPAIGYGTSCPATDQRGIARGASCTIGALEVTH
jgi:hypothetical protein